MFLSNYLFTWLPPPHPPRLRSLKAETATDSSLHTQCCLRSLADITHSINSRSMNEKRNKHTGRKLACVHGMSHLSDCNERNPFHGSAPVYSSHKEASPPRHPCRNRGLRQTLGETEPRLSYYRLTQLQTHLAHLCLGDTGTLLPQVPGTFHPLSLEFSSLYLQDPLF